MIFNINLLYYYKVFILYANKYHFSSIKCIFLTFLIEIYVTEKNPAT